MQSRMDRYNNIESDNQIASRAARNQVLYDKIKSSDIKRHDVNNNMSVIEDNIKAIDINKVHNFLDEKYGDNVARRSGFSVPEISQTQEIDPIMDTKEYDINAILERAKQGKNIDYSKERLKKVRAEQYEILNNLDSEIKNLSEVDAAKAKRKKEEENLKQLINTITEIELKNQMRDTTHDLDLLSDLVGDPDDEKVDSFSMDDTKAPIDIETIDITKELEHIKEQVNKANEENKEEAEDTKDLEQTKEDIEDTTPDIVIGGVQEVQDTMNSKIVSDKEVIEKNEKKPVDKEEHIEGTLNKLDIDLSNYEDFNDINKKDKASSVLRIIIFIVFIALVLGAVVILNNLLGLELLPF